jgi:phage tail sheath protein FI
MAYNHRIETREIDTQINIPTEGTAGLQVVVGTAPVNMAEDPAAVVNIPVIAYSFSEAQRLLGYSDEFDKYTLCQSMSASFRIFAVAPVIFINVLDPAVHKKAYTKTGITVISGRATVTDTDIILEDLAVTDQDDGPLTLNTDYLIEFNGAGGLDITLLTTPATASVTGLKLSGYQLDPTMVTAADIIGGYNTSTGAETGLELIRQVYPRFGMTPGLIIAPGWSQNPAVAAVMCAKTENINGVFTCETVIDMDTETTRLYTALAEAKEAMGITNKHAILLWPKVKAGGKIYSYSAAWAALTAYTDAQNGDVPARYPSNKLLNVSAAVLSDGAEVLLDTTMAETVNENGIVTVINDAGWRAWGNNTAAYPGTVDPKDRWIACRRMMSWYRNHFILTFKAKIDEPTNPRLIESIVDSENLYLNGLTSTGDIAGGSISYNEADNPIEAILNGRIIFYTKIAFWTPAEYIVNEIEFDPTIIQNALGGA